MATTLTILRFEELIKTWQGRNERPGSFPSSATSSNAANYLLTILAHEIGHGFFNFCHTWGVCVKKDALTDCLKEDPPDQSCLDAKDLENQHIKFGYIDSRLRPSNSFSREIPDVCSVMSYCFEWNDVVKGTAWVHCGQRHIAGWSDGPDTPYGICRDGVHILNSSSGFGRAINLDVQFEWDHNWDSPVAVVKWDSYVENSGAKVRNIECGPLPTQTSDTRDVMARLKHREDGILRGNVSSSWQRFGRAVREHREHGFLYEGGGEVRSEHVLKKGQEYEFWVQINCAGGHASSFSPQSVSATTPRAWKPTPPGKPNPTKVEDRYISIDWPSALGEVERHEIQWRPAQTTSAWEQRLQPNADRFFGNDGFAPGTCYEFRVRAGNDAGWSDWSQTARVCTESGLIPPDPPRDLVLRSGTGAIEVAWDTAPEHGSAVTGYKVRWRDSSILSSINPWAWNSQQVPNDQFSFPIGDLEVGKTYVVEVVALSEAGDSNPVSARASVLAAPRPSGSVRISEGAVNASRTSKGQCSGRDCHDLRYTISGLGSGPYATECWFNGQQAWSGTWSGNASTGCYYSAAFSGTVHVVIDGVRSNTLSIAAKQAVVQTAEPDRVGRPAVSAGDGHVTVSWTAPASNGAPIVEYDVLADGGNSGVSVITGTYGATSTTVTGLTNGVAYSVQVRARNSVGWGDWSSAERATPEAAAQPPDPPRNVSVSAGDGQVAVSWDASPANGSPVTGYTVSWSGSDNNGSRRLGASARSFTVPSLTNGVGYTVSVAARSAAGNSAAVSLAAFPKAAARVPDAPRSLVLEPGDGQIEVSWRASRENGSPVTGYVVAWSDGSRVGGTTLSTSADDYTIKGLSNGSRYDVEVSAQSRAGASPAATGRATPEAAASPPDAPRNVKLVSGAEEIVVSWQAPDDNGAPLGWYEVKWRLATQDWWFGPDRAVSSTGHRITGLKQNTQYVVQVRAQNSEGWGPWSSSKTTTTGTSITIYPVSVTIARGNAVTRSDCKSPCYALSYQISGLGSAPYTLECWLNGRRVWRDSWSGRASSGCYYSDAFNGTIYVVVDGERSNTVRF